MTSSGVVVVGGSAGSHPALLSLVAGLPAGLPAAVLVVIHVSAQATSHLPDILSREGQLPAAHASDGAPLRDGEILVAPPGWHLLVGDGQVRLGNGPRVNRARPAVDVLFESAAQAAGPRVVAVVLSGMLDDGAVGAARVALTGGQVLVQEPSQAPFPSMPRFLAGDETQLTRLACPDCGGGMAQITLPTIAYFRCHIGHRFSPQVLAAAQAEAAEAKLWSAVAALEEQAVMLRHLTSHQEPASPAPNQTSAAPRPPSTLVTHNRSPR